MLVHPNPNSSVNESVSQTSSHTADATAGLTTPKQQQSSADVLTAFWQGRSSFSGRPRPHGDCPDLESTWASPHRQVQARFEKLHTHAVTVQCCAKWLSELARGDKRPPIKWLWVVRSPQPCNCVQSHLQELVPDSCKATAATYMITPSVLRRDTQSLRLQIATCDGLTGSLFHSQVSSAVPLRTALHFLR